MMRRPPTDTPKGHLNVIVTKNTQEWVERCVRAGLYVSCSDCVESILLDNLPVELMPVLPDKL